MCGLPNTSVVCARTAPRPSWMRSSGPPERSSSSEMEEGGSRSHRVSVRAEPCLCGCASVVALGFPSSLVDPTPAAHRRGASVCDLHLQWRLRAEFHGEHAEVLEALLQLSITKEEMGEIIREVTLPKTPHLMSGCSTTVHVLPLVVAYCKQLHPRLTGNEHLDSRSCRLLPTGGVLRTHVRPTPHLVPLDRVLLQENVGPHVTLAAWSFLIMFAKPDDLVETLQRQLQQMTDSNILGRPIPCACSRV